jgi:hypothetical protein
MTSLVSLEIEADDARTQDDYFCIWKHNGICQNVPSARIPTAIIKWLTSISDQEAV